LSREETARQSKDLITTAALDRLFKSIGISTPQGNARRAWREQWIASLHSPQSGRSSGSHRSILTCPRPERVFDNPSGDRTSKTASASGAYRRRRGTRRGSGILDQPNNCCARRIRSGTRTPFRQFTVHVRQSVQRNAPTLRRNVSSPIS